MAGWNLKSGKFNDECKNEDAFWAIINNFLSNKTNKTSSYKYCFFKSILDNVFNVDDNGCISYNLIFERFTEIYWNLIVKYKLSQIQANSSFDKSTIEIIISGILEKYNIDDTCSFNALRSDIKNELNKKVLALNCSFYVVGAFYTDTKQSFYLFDRAKKILTFKLNVLDYLIKYKNILSKLNYYEWVKFLEKTNDELAVISIAEKLEWSSKRENLSFYRDFLFDCYGSDTCFYCGKKLNKKQIEMDHFIPWSFVKDDKIWNLVISCRKCNNSKRDKLAPERFIKELQHQNLMIKKNNQYDLVRKEFESYNDNKIKDMYSSAIFNGFNEIWKLEE